MAKINSYIKVNKKKFKIQVQKKDINLKKKNCILSNKYGSNLLKKIDWYKKGYSIENIFTIPQHLNNQKKISYCVKKILKIKNRNFSIENYHYCVNDANHLRTIQKTRELKIDVFQSIKDKIYSYLNDKYKISFKKNKMIKKEIALLRIHRPKKNDLNPPHRDGYLRCWSKSLNIWYMISGSFKNSSLPIIPKSHLVNEKFIQVTRSNSKMNGTKYTVPIILRINNKNMSFKIPKIKPGQVLIFSPFLIHGFGKNFSANKTRSSLEFRPEINE